MTCIAVVSDGTRCCMAADSQATNNGTVAVLSDSKIVRVGPLLIAAEGTASIAQWARNRIYQPIDAPTSFRVMGIDWPKPSEPLEKWAADVFADSLRDYLSQRQLLRNVNGSNEMPGQILIARGPQWIVVDAGGSVYQFASDWWAIGSGAPEARGAMWHAAQSEHFEANHIAVRGVEAAIALDNGCCAPVRVEWTDPGEVLPPPDPSLVNYGEGRRP